ncbi:hypothetical protein BU24DRAFT_426584 [Aaosphaeria arxii CBS 175.79]|uniref:Uncharacterized protein n=1 Tax=Aaosphaeria arxii CBS 175.79 TaxID=1450172 RepID=A0A6A5XF67_9PLEO|nr:uncharacterized protein BU24DRAFT_426584 [Aaosphaeria arxii CBS 175.79]KAF2011501.1 hypothetical protein BU24DRAFT_426584 [Aaosphaeria arxii CBS 175.79]
MCDFDKGGDTVTAIGLEATPQKCVFWVASNSSPEKEIGPFLESLLTKLYTIAFAKVSSKLMERENLIAKCINFAAPRIKKYRALLKNALKRCLDHLRTMENEDLTGLSEWLQRWESQQDPDLVLCRFAYDQRKSEPMRMLARLSTEPKYKSDRHAIRHSFGLVRHYIGRLGHHFRAADTLLSCVARLQEDLHDFEVRCIPRPPKSSIPTADGKTNLKSILVRMLPAKSPDHDRYQEALVEMDTKHHLSRDFLKNYKDSGWKARVHAEIQVLEHFHAGKLSFASGDPFIACSKPACFCCLLYFQHHPGDFVLPASHRKIYLNWRPPDAVPGDENSELCLRAIIDAMTKTIRRDALRQIEEKVPPKAWHPDSLTRITESAVLYDKIRESLDNDSACGSKEPLMESEHCGNSSWTRNDDLSSVFYADFSGSENGQTMPEACYSFEERSDESDGGVVL